MTHEDFMSIVFKDMDLATNTHYTDVIMLVIAESILFGDYETESKGWTR